MDRNRILYAEALIKPNNNHSLFFAEIHAGLQDIKHFHSCKDTREKCRLLLEQKGFNVIHVNSISVSFSGSAALFEKHFSVKLILRRLHQHDALTPGSIPEKNSMQENPWIIEVQNSSDPFLIDTRSHKVFSIFEGIVILGIAGLAGAPGNGLPAVQPLVPAVQPCPPAVPYENYITVPGELAGLLGAEILHQKGITGRGRSVAIVDTGCYDHPFFRLHNYSIRRILSPGTNLPETDEIGHGTLVCANVCAAAPAAEIQFIKQNDDHPLAAFKMAVDLQPDVIQNTWGNAVNERPLNAKEKIIRVHIINAVADGIIVVFAGGNAGSGFLFPSQMPEVIAAGGVYRHKEGKLEAADYASGYLSQLFPGRIVPDFCGFVGMQPKGIYIMLPTQPASVIDKDFAAKPYPEGDNTAPDDGWVCISGTSSASGQISGICALIRQVQPGISPYQVKEILAKTSTNIVYGKSAQGNPAEPYSPDWATGYGLVNAANAIAALSGE